MSEPNRAHAFTHHLVSMPEVDERVGVIAHQTYKVGTVVKVGRTLAEIAVPMGNGTTKIVRRHLNEMQWPSPRFERLDDS
jgi:hypothetical protein